MRFWAGFVVASACAPTSPAPSAPPDAGVVYLFVRGGVPSDAALPPEQPVQQFRVETSVHTPGYSYRYLASSQWPDTGLPVLGSVFVTITDVDTLQSDRFAVRAFFTHYAWEYYQFELQVEDQEPPPMDACGGEQCRGIAYPNGARARIDVELDETHRVQTGEVVLGAGEPE